MAEIDDDLKQAATRIADKYLGFAISCQGLYADVVAELAAERSRSQERIKALTDEMQQWKRRDHLSLHVGEVTAQEFRTVVALLTYFQGRARALLEAK